MVRINPKMIWIKEKMIRINPKMIRIKEEMIGMGRSGRRRVRSSFFIQFELLDSRLLVLRSAEV